MPIVDFQPTGRKIEIETDASILDAARKAGVGLPAICGGENACGCCIVYLSSDASVSPVSTIEKDKLSSEDLDKGYRLACQAKITGSITGSITVNIPARSLTAKQRTQIEGEEILVELEPSIKVYDLELKKADVVGLSADWERMCKGLTDAGAIMPQRNQLNMIKTLPSILRNNGWKVRIGLRNDYVVSVSKPGTPVLGLAVDIGTTKVAGYLIDLENGKTLAMAGMMNPQISYGEDIMTRISYIQTNRNGNDDLRNLITEALNELAKDLCKEATKTLISKNTEIAFRREQIAEAVIVGNTAMHHVFLGLPVDQLGVAPYIAAISSGLDVKSIELGLDFSPGAVVHLLPNIAGFVGADHVSMLLAADMLSEKGNAFYIDIGTNTEITLKANGRFVACSTASGPAFEGAHIKDGMRAADGAIERVKIVGNEIKYQTINDSKPVGICGSGILDAIAQLRIANIINNRGAFDPENPAVRRGEKGLEVVIATSEMTEHGQDITLSRKDVSEIQLAKGAIRAGIELLMKEVGISAADVDKFIIAGAFGSYIDIGSAITIGMFPDLPTDCFRQIGNAAGIGAKMTLLSISKKRETKEMAEKIEYLELSNHREFLSEFTRAMSL